MPPNPQRSALPAHTIRFGHVLGTHPSHDTNYFDTVLAIARVSEQVGLHALFYSDHLQYQRANTLVRSLQRAAKLLHRWPALQSTARTIAAWCMHRSDNNPQRTLAVLECFTTLAALATATEHIQLGALVAAAPYRHPALLAKINTTLDIISHGRCIIGIGAGWYEEEFTAYGWPFPTAKQRLERLEETIHIIDALMTQRRATYHGQHYHLVNALTNPHPIQRPRPPLMIGGSGERRTLRLVARYADYCNLFGDPPTVAHKLTILRAHCAAVGRPYESITRSNFVSILIARTETELARKRRHYPPWLGHAIIGTPDRVRAALQAYIDIGINFIVFNLPDAHTLEPITLLAETVIPSLVANTTTS